MASSPIVTVNLWFDRPVLDEPFVGLPGRDDAVGVRQAPGVRRRRRRTCRSSRAARRRSSTRTERRADRRGARANCSRRCRARRQAQLLRGDGRSRAARDVLAGARPAAAARHADGRARALSSPATGSTPGCPRRSRARSAAAIAAADAALTPRIAVTAGMNSIVVHYKELALKGRNRPWFVQILVRNLRTALAGLDVVERPLGDGPDRDRARRRTRRGPRCATGCRRVFGIANFSYAGRGAARLRAAGRGHPRRPRRPRSPSRSASACAGRTSGFRSRRRRSSAKSAG